MSPAGRPALRCHAAPGFTLLELLVVLTIIATLLVFAVPMLRSGGPQTGVRAKAGEIAATLRLARSEAIRQNRDMAVAFDLDRRIFRSDTDGQEHPLPVDAEIALVTAGEELTPPETGRIRFFSDGSSTGGRITMTVGGRDFFVDVTWLTGGVVLGP